MSFNDLVLSLSTNILVSSDKQPVIPTTANFFDKDESMDTVFPVYSAIPVSARISRLISLRNGKTLYWVNFSVTVTSYIFSNSSIKCSSSLVNASMYTAASSCVGWFSFASLNVSHIVDVG